MKSNLNFKILKLCVSDICLQMGFDRTSEQSLNIISDVLKYYIIQISLNLHRSLGSTVFSEGSLNFLLKSLVSENSLQEVEIISFLKSQNSIKKNLNDLENNKSLLHSLRILPNDQNFIGINRHYLHEIENEPKLKVNLVKDTIEKDEELKKFLKSCSIDCVYKNEPIKVDFNLMILLDDKKNVKFTFDQEKDLIYKTFDYFEIWNDTQDILMDYDTSISHKIFKY